MVADRLSLGLLSVPPVSCWTLAGKVAVEGLAEVTPPYASRPAWVLLGTTVALEMVDEGRVRAEDPEIEKREVSISSIGRVGARSRMTGPVVSG